MSVERAGAHRAWTSPQAARSPEFPTDVPFLVPRRITPLGAAREIHDADNGAQLILTWEPDAVLVGYLLEDSLRQSTPALPGVDQERPAIPRLRRTILY